MSATLDSALKKSMTGQLLEVKRRIRKVGSSTGFIVDFSDSLLVLHTLNMDTFRLNGYAVLRKEDISHYRLFAKTESWEMRAVRHFRLKPMRPSGVSVNSLPELLKSVAENYPLITFHPEKKKPDVCYIGPVTSMTDHTFTIEDLDSKGAWSGPRRMKFSDVTMVNFGGGYEEALAVTSPKRPKRRI